MFLLIKYSDCDMVNCKYNICVSPTCVHQVLHWIFASHLKMRIVYWLTFCLWSYSETDSEPFQLALMWLLFPIILSLEYRYFEQAFLNPLIVYI